MKKHSIVWAIILLGGGIWLLLNAFGIGEAISLVPALGSLLLLAVSVLSFLELNFVMGLVPLALIAYIWRVDIGYPDMNVWILLLSAVMLGIGLSIVFGKRLKEKFTGKFQSKSCEDWSKVITSEDSETVTVDTTFGESVKYVHSENFKAARINVSFGSAKVYFDQCQVSPEGATIYVNCNFGEVQLFIPRSWNIDNHINVFAADVSGASMASGDYTKVTLAGDVKFGDVKVRYL